MKVILLSLLLAIESLAVAHFDQGEPRAGIFLHPAKKVPPVLKFETTEKKEISSSDFFQNKWSLVYIGYTQCGSTCPSDMARVKSFFEKNAKQLTDIQFVFISADPEKDEPQQLKTYLNSFGKDFVGLTSNVTSRDKILEFFESPFRKASDGLEMIHSSNLYLVDPHSNWRKFYSFPFVSQEILGDLKNLMESGSS